MSSKMWASICSALSAMLATTWCVMLFAPMTWLRVESVLIVFEVTLFTVTSRHGIVGAILDHGMDYLRGRHSSSYFDQIMDQTLWLDTALSRMCAIPGGHRFCAEFNYVVLGSWIMLACGIVAVLLFYVGAGCTLYYANEHATETGRAWIRMCLFAAPMAACIGFLMYSLMVFGFGKAFQSSSRIPYGHAWIVCLFLVMISFLPILILGVFGKADRNEKKWGENDMLVETGRPGGYSPGLGAGYPSQPAAHVVQGNYGAPPPAYGNYGAPPPVYGAAPPAYGMQGYNPSYGVSGPQQPRMPGMHGY